MKVFRADAGQLSKPVMLPNGFMKCDAFIARSGVLEYQRADGSTWREYRAPEEAFSADSLASFDLVPFTNDHPAGGLVTADNAREYQRGMVQGPRQDGDRVRATVLVTDAETIAAMKAGKLETSCGYWADVIAEPGVTPQGERYDARQTNVRGNHVALVDAGRAGPSVRVRVDSLNADLVVSDSKPIGTPSHTHETMIKINIGGVQYEVSEQVAQAITRERNDAREALDTSRTETKTALSNVEKITARADQADSDVKKLKAELETAPTKALEQMKARHTLETQAEKALGAEAKFDGKTDAEIRRMVAESVLEQKFDGKSDVYVEAMFDLACARADEKQAEPETAEIENVAGTKTDREPTSAELAEQMRKRTREAYRTSAS